MGVGRLEGIARALIEGGRAPSTPSALIVEATTPRQRVVEAPLAEIAAAAREAGVRPPALLVVGEVVALRERLAPALRRPLAGWRVLVTRTRRQASSLAEALRAEGAEPVLLPAIEIARRADPEAVRAAIEALRAGAYDWVAFTSGNAVEAWFDLVREAGEDARLFSGARIAAVGAATARALEARGLTADLLPPRASGGGVADALLECGVEGARVLVPRAERADPALVERLRAGGASVDEVTLYLAAPPADPPPELLAALRAGEIEALTFTSSSTVRNLAALLGGDLDGPAPRRRRLHRPADRRSRARGRPAAAGGRRARLGRRTRGGAAKIRGGGVMAAELSSIENVNPRKVWPNEASDFTPWLAEHIDLLGEALGLDIEVTQTEAAVGAFSLDILGKVSGSDRVVIVENQLERTDHVHLGQLLAYAAGLDAKIVVWISPDGPR